jgi:hypothetical protein
VEATIGQCDVFHLDAGAGALDQLELTISRAVDGPVAQHDHIRVRGHTVLDHDYWRPDMLSRYKVLSAAVDSCGGVPEVHRGGRGMPQGPGTA